MLPPLQRACLLALVMALAVPLAAAQTPAGPTPPTAPDPTECNEAVGRACLPDLLIQNPSSSNEDERSPTTFCASFVNIGSGPTATRFRMLLTVDGVDTAEATFDDVYQTGQGATRCWDPFPIPKGSHTYVVRVDSGNDVIEQDESNNAAARSFYVDPAPQIDLRTRLTVSPHTADANRNVIFTVNVTNLGALTSPATVVDLWDSGGMKVRLPIPELEPGTTKTSIHVVYSNALPVGRFLAEAEVDQARAIAEISETNNHASFEYEVLEHPAPDLVVTDVRTTGNLTAHRGIRIDAVVKNQGDRLAQGIVVRLLDASNASLANATRAQLIPNANATFQLYVALPAGNHTLRVVADPDGRVLERREANNEASITLEVADLPVELDGPNLIVERLQTPFGEPRPNQTITFGTFVRNVGTNASNASKVTITIQSRQVGTAPIPALKPNHSYYALVTWSGASVGSYVVHATVDLEERVREIDEADNTLSMDLYLDAPPPPEEEAPVVTTPPTIEPPIATPTPPTTTVNRTNATPPRITFSEMEFDIRPVAGGVRGTLTAIVRNLNTQPTGGFSLRWSVDGREIKQSLQLGLQGAASATLSTGDIELPAGNHIVTAEIRFLGTSAPAITREKPYDVAAGASSLIPGFEAIALVAAALVIVGVRRRR